MFSTLRHSGCLRFQCVSRPSGLNCAIGVGLAVKEGFALRLISSPISSRDLDRIIILKILALIQEGNVHNSRLPVMLKL
jgi:hypothetical protein